MNLSRRKFLKLSALGAMASGLGAYWLTNGDHRPDLIRAILDKRLGQRLNLDEDGIDRFIAEYRGEAARLGGLKMKLVTGLYPVYLHSNLLELTPARDFLWWLERDVTEAFLMGTDFFFDVEGFEEEGKLLTFYGLYDPLERPCSNPFGVLS